MWYLWYFHELKATLEMLDRRQILKSKTMLGYFSTAKNTNFSCLQILSEIKLAL